MTMEEAMQILTEHKNEYFHTSRIENAIDTAIEALSAEPKRGEWIEAQIDTAEFPINFLECSACGYRIGRETYLENTFTYCPNCGAYMGDKE